MITWTGAPLARVGANDTNKVVKTYYPFREGEQLK